MVQSQQKRAVGRPREFNEEQALESVMAVFWDKGYEATSLTDLCAATGLHKGSLYQAFGDKHTLFMRALKHYADREFQETAAVAFEHDSPIARIRAVIGAVCKEALEGKGCLMINSLVELAPHDPEVHKAVASEGERRHRVISEFVEKAQQAGEIRAELDPQMLARQLMIGFAGSAAMAKGLATTPEVIAVLNSMVDGWT